MKDFLKIIAQKFGGTSFIAYLRSKKTAPKGVGGIFL